MHKSDLCITRAGASTLAELNFTEIPYLLQYLYQLQKIIINLKMLIFKINLVNWLLNQKEIDEKYY